jgi:AcrR family transcriptional regulator
MGAGVPPARTEPPRRTWRGEERCGQIRAVAAELFLAHGYDGVSVDEVVRRAGGSKANVYRHFGGKEGLFAQVIEDLCAEILAPLAALDTADLPVDEALRALGRRLLGALLQERHLAFHRLVIAEAGRFPALGQVWFRQGPQTSGRILAAFIKAQQEAGRLRAGDPDRAAALLHDMLTFDLLHRALTSTDGGPTADQVEQVMEEAVALFLHGFGRAD